MMRYCGHCGVPLDARALTTGRCPSCGATISATQDALMPTYPTTMPDSSPTTLSDRTIGVAEWPGAPGTGTTRPARGAKRVMVVVGVLLLLCALMLICVDVAIVAAAQ